MFLPILLIGLHDPVHLQTGAPAQQTRSAKTDSRNLSDYLGMILAADLAARVDSSQQAASLFVGIKVGMPVALRGDYPSTHSRTMTLDLGYDRAQAGHGVSAELSMLLPVARFPAPHNLQGDICPHLCRARRWISCGAWRLWRLCECESDAGVILG